MPSQRPFFLSTFFSSFRQSTALSAQQPNKHSTQTSSSASYATQSAASAPRAISSNAASSSSATATAAANSATRSTSGVVNQYPLHSPRGGIPIPGSHPNRRRGSDSSSEGFRDVLGADKWYIGGRTAGGEEKFFKLGVVRRVRSNDGLSLDRLSL
ncbi:hypothetical protein CGCF415_v006993 [Colletotrichum fructicola]|uniref:Uncharacterized protein n=2 Tax=Colletotrichum gloeosporioides species complex TaxID=2707338 RepID=L2GGZ6_COLFN|nr:uncharacterized protein CGMCC3_g103 [Colletotrichum fructicola]KAF4475527.1 hypothetical protein CGGC5_v016434 [Colletotrichum fructicola Nara gc5]KAH9231128.1 hypothetical protein K456DRAFT_435062 [Colletotrichum gloeosporioides 23]KAI8280196.1 hypothetical protein K4K60_005033 [Colletotrichum sp. SAR11_57]KAJ0277424.1 hypothetical protein COL940_007778 [Colletotrichum noveboracense]KAJ0284608.1 hypothetical protein CBS470a_006748 [Colletotrichum nupharicola]